MSIEVQLVILWVEDILARYVMGDDYLSYHHLYLTIAWTTIEI